MMSTTRSAEGGSSHRNVFAPTPRNCGWVPTGWFAAGTPAVGNLETLDKLDQLPIYDLSS